jgi:hypothetical protein
MNGKRQNRVFRHTSAMASNDLITFAESAIFFHSGRSEHYATATAYTYKHTCAYPLRLSRMLYIKHAANLQRKYAVRSMASVDGPTTHIVSNQMRIDGGTVSMANGSVERAGTARQADRSRAPRRPFGVGAGAIGVPAVIGYLHPAFGVILASSEAVVIVVVFAAALFGSPAISERAFRLLRWLRNRPEPPAPSTSTPSSQSAGSHDSPTAS